MYIRLPYQWGLTQQDVRWFDSPHSSFSRTASAPQHCSPSAEGRFSFYPKMVLVFGLAFKKYSQLCNLRAIGRPVFFFNMGEKKRTNDIAVGGFAEHKHSLRLDLFSSSCPRSVYFMIWDQVRVRSGPVGLASGGSRV